MNAVEHIKSNLHSITNRIDKFTFNIEGVLTKSIGLTLEAKGFKASIGTLCIIEHCEQELTAIVTGFTEEYIYLMPIQDASGIEPGCKVLNTGRKVSCGVGHKLLGRVIDGAGRPLDNLGRLDIDETRLIFGNVDNPLQRRIVNKIMDVGIRSINGLLTIGEGQRIGLFAGSGVGKSVLLGMISRFTAAEVVVVALIGERGREVKEFIAHNLKEDGMKKAVVIASPANYSPVLRLHGAFVAMAVAEFFRDSGKQVLLLMDSLTRFAQAQREIALSMGEPPATKGYPPSVFALLPQLIERAGNSNGTGSITGIFTVLAEGDDHNDPIVDAARAILDGHVILSRRYAEMGLYPAVDIDMSISRVMSNIVDDKQLKTAVKFKRLHALYEENKDLINIGAYVKGQNAELDWAIENITKIKNYLQQDMNKKYDYQESYAELTKLLESYAR